MSRKKDIPLKVCSSQSSWFNRFEGFCTDESINDGKVVDFLDRNSSRVTKKTFVVLDNTSVPRNAIIKQMQSFREKRRLLLFYIPLYSPRLNIIEILWKVMKGMWLKPQDYTSCNALRCHQSIGEN